MYSLKNVFTKSPNVIAAAIMAWVNLGVILNWIPITGEVQTAALNLAVAATLSLFVSTANQSAQKDEALKGIELGKVLSGTGDGTLEEPPVFVPETTVTGALSP